MCRRTVFKSTSPSVPNNGGTAPWFCLREPNLQQHLPFEVFEYYGRM